VPRANIIGKGWLLYWPPSKLGLVKHYTYPELGQVSEQMLVLDNPVEA